MALDKNIKQIHTTEALNKSSSTGKKFAVLTDGNSNFVWTDVSNSKLMYAPVMKYYDKGAASDVYPYNTFGETAFNDDVVINRYITKTKDTYTNAISLQDNNLTLVAGGANALTVTSGLVTASVTFSAGANATIAGSLTTTGNIIANNGVFVSDETSTNTFTIENFSGGSFVHGNHEHTQIVAYSIPATGTYSVSLHLVDDPSSGKVELEILADFGAGIGVYYQNVRYIYALAGNVLSYAMIDNTTKVVIGTDTVTPTPSAAGSGNVVILTFTNNSTSYTATGVIRINTITNQNTDGVYVET
jgi:hypothetical protein